MKKRALISVSDKQGITDFAKQLVEFGYEIISTGGTLTALQKAGIPAISVEDITGFPEILDGRVKTLHPFIHGGILAKQANPEHVSQLKAHSIERIDIVIVNLYPFKQTLLNKEATRADKIENIDIGGPTMLRAAAKNYENITVVVDPADYSRVLEALKNNKVHDELRKQLAAKVFRHTANYDAMISGFFNEITNDEFPETYTATYEKVQTLRYGENPHQRAAFYRDPRQEVLSIAAAKQLHGKALSYNNIQDANACLEIISEYKEPAVVAVKHMNPCGIGVADSLYAAFQKAYAADPISIFGGIVAANKEIDQSIAEQLSNIFLEIIIAPSFTEEALALLTTKKNIRLLTLSMDELPSMSHKLTSVNGGLLVQSMDHARVKEADLEFVTRRKPTEAELCDLLFAWKAVKHVKSNAIVLAKKQQTVGIGAGQMNRVGAATIAINQAEEQAIGAVLASDAFFPMPDTVEAAAKAGITAIIQPGGSKRDQDSIDVCNENGIAMVFTKIRHFKH
ncbi:bifunctional phosphoribosylaminoimidazolecarboxamide formyltransferase/IMP cyclohydrolase [Virgibacillus sp. LDC-1]|uniref:bifunctional phosphoribosylaminoimidazolecarboxamide formyltransferase/IMP cyclohydrolase n=1 Tax=Virgibacillus sp. LDC-1 TaxID=3039856 RepID=UPI0024DEAF80|nr:bifunctional phosphoribosylaminoimidazolecarboxamide formyltransferase/IMP cyclohydrolase [Virgibacillus sp. LDC-1]